MKFLLLALLSFLSVSLGAPQARLRQDNGSDHFIYPAWPITNFDAGCSPGGCIILFNMTAFGTDMEPSVTAECNIIGSNKFWQECDALPGNTPKENGSVWAKPLPSVETFDVSVEHRFFNDTVVPFRAYNVSGNMSVDYQHTKLPVNLTLYALYISETWSWAT